MAGTRSGRKSAETMDSAKTSSFEKTKSEVASTESLVRYETWDAEKNGEQEVVANMETIALKALHVDDDPTLNPWTFRMFFLGEYLLATSTH